MIMIKIKSSEKLFSDWMAMSCHLGVLGNIVQNDVELDEYGLSDWKIQIERFQSEFNGLYEKTIEHIISCKMNETVMDDDEGEPLGQGYVNQD